MKRLICGMMLLASSLAWGGDAQANTFIKHQTGNGFESVGDSFYIPSLNVPGYGNFEIHLLAYSTSNPMSTSWQVQSMTPTTTAATATYDLGTGLIHVPVKATFQGLTGTSCVQYDAYMGAYMGLWTLVSMRMVGVC
jgi:hypothetical protein